MIWKTFPLLIREASSALEAWRNQGDHLQPPQCKQHNLISSQTASLCTCVFTSSQQSIGGGAEPPAVSDKVLISVADDQQVSDIAGHNKYIDNTHTHTNRCTFLLSLWLCFLCVCVHVCAAEGHSVGGLAAGGQENGGLFL